MSKSDLELLQDKIKESEYDWLLDRMILIAPTGSYAYGTNHENSDKDFKGICIPPKSYYLGLNSYNEYNTSGGKNFKNTKDDVDVAVMHVNKFVNDALSGTPSSIEMLFLKPEQYLYIHELGQVLIDNRHLFLSKAIRNKYAGYAKSQMERIKIKKNNGTGRQDLVEKFGYDTKFAMHCVRLLTSGDEILVTGNFSTYRSNRQFLTDIRMGKYSYTEIMEIIETLDATMKKSLEESKLPDRPDWEKIDKMLIEINEKALAL